MATKIITRSDVNVEAVLSTHLVARAGKPRWQYVEGYSVSDIERKIDAQSRISPVNKASVATIAAKMAAGVTFPPIILWETEDNGVVLVDGNHRALAAARNKQSTIPAYMVHLDNSDEAVYLSAVFNGQIGNPLTKDEVRRAVIAARHRGVSDLKMSQDFGVARGTVASILATNDAMNRANRLGASIEGLSRTHLATLGKIVMDRPFKEAVRLVQQAGLSTGATSTLVAAIAAAPKEEAEQVAVIEAERSARQDEIASIAVGRKSSGSPFSDLRGLINTMSRIRDSYPDASSWVTRDQETVRAWLPAVEEFAAFASNIAEQYRSASA